jgi:hypothetical protein
MDYVYCGSWNQEKRNDARMLEENVDTMLEAVRGLPLLDAHTHLVDGRLGARGLHDVVLYHMSISELHAAGCPSAERLTAYPDWPDEHETQSRLVEAIPYLDSVRNTSIQWGIRMMLAELYNWKEAVTLDNWERLDGIIRERSDDGAWHREVMHRAGIQRACTELARREAGDDDDALQYALEWAFFTRCQWGEYDTALYELERCWGKTPDSPMPIGSGKRPVPERAIHSLRDVHEGIAWYVNQIPVEKILSTATHLSTDIEYQEISDTTMTRALERRGQATAAERDIYASYINEHFLTALEEKCGDSVVFQFSLGAEPLPTGTDSRLSQRTIAYVGKMVASHPGLRFQCFLSSAHANQSLCTLCRELPNLSLAGYWWHNFFPATMERVMAERLDMLPVNKQIGFFSDAYCIEWSWAKAEMIRRVLAKVLEDKIRLGQYDQESALSVAKSIFFDAPQELLGMVPQTKE